MPLNILHTADWHLGQTFYEYDRSFEHAEYLSWLKTTISEKEIDVLLISGDIFDVSNPSAASMGQFYRFLKEVTFPGSIRVKKTFGSPKLYSASAKPFTRSRAIENCIDNK